MTLQGDEDKQLTKFWELKEIKSKNSEKKLSQDEKACEEIFENTVQRSKNGRYTVNIPFKENKEKLDK